MEKPTKDIDPQETKEWLDSVDEVLQDGGEKRLKFLLNKAIKHAEGQGARMEFSTVTPYINTIQKQEEKQYPGERKIERKIKSIIRWNAMAMVVRANHHSPGIGGHISTYASGANLLEVAFNHFFKGPKHKNGADLVYFQGHSSPGIYARAFVEGRLSEKHLENFRRELSKDGGLSSYPHPWLMPDFWQFATVSMGLGPLMAIYQARFMNYLIDRGLMKNTERKVWAFLGDGEMDEPESMGALTMASRERLDNLIFVINCNLQRLDGPVRGNGKIIQELEGAFRGAGWNVIKVIWGEDWDDIIEKDKKGLLLKRMEEVVDGEMLKYTVEGGGYFRKNFFGKDPALKDLIKNLSDKELGELRTGGHDPEKMYAAYHEASNHKGQPTVILARTIKGYGLGDAGEVRNITLQQKKLNEEELLFFRDRFEIPLTDKQAKKAQFFRFKKNSKEEKYIKQKRKSLGGFLPSRKKRSTKKFK